MKTLPPATAEHAARKRCFDPVIDRHTRLLVLGSLPGDQSLMREQYYGNRQNKFWSLVSHITQTDLVALDYPARLSTLLGHRIGLWDVVAEARRTGSLDTSIRERHDNDLCGLLAAFPAVAAIAFNGGAAARIGIKLLGERAACYRIVQLPSSSPAHTLAYAEKLRAWLPLRELIGPG
ncbi:MAG: DNA-deoxyinosine glycosylase [Pseudomonadota bacterium]